MTDRVAESDADYLCEAVGALKNVVAVRDTWAEDAVECLRRLWKRDFEAAMGQRTLVTGTSRVKPSGVAVIGDPPLFRCTWGACGNLTPDVDGACAEHQPLEVAYQEGYADGKVTTATELADTKNRLTNAIDANTMWCVKHKAATDHLATAVEALRSVELDELSDTECSHVAGEALRKIRGGE
jgi:hypothetical protein